MQRFVSTTSPDSLSSNDGGDHKKDQEPTTGLSKPKRFRKVLVACNRCRKKKDSCDGKRPVCTRCIQDNTICSYVSATINETPTMVLKRQIGTLEQELKDHSDILDYLLSVPDSKAIEAIRAIKRLKTTSNPSLVLASIKGNPHALTRISESKTVRAVLPPTESLLEFELNVLHQSVYPALEPLDIDSINLDNLFTYSRSKSPSLLTFESMSSSKDEEVEGVIITPITTAPPSPLRGINSKRSSDIAGPLQNHQFCDSRLNRLNVAYWTRIPISNEFAACVLSHYLKLYHPIFACFDANHFVSDLVEQKLDYCSLFLFNALMSIACQSYSVYDVRSSALSIAFTQDSEVLWNANRNSDTTLTLAAMCYLSMACTMNGKDQLASQLAAESRSMALRMNLFGVEPTNDLILTFHQLPSDKIKDFAHAAWGSYSWLTYRNTYFPSEPIEFEPLLPIPGDSKRHTSLSNLIWPTHNLPLYMGQTFPTLCKLWVIIQEINSVYTLTSQTPLIQRVSLDFAESKYQRLLTWGDTILPEMSRGDYTYSHVLFFHGIYHCTVLSLFRPFLESSDQPHLRSFSSIDGTPSSAYSASMNQLKRIIYNYRTQFHRISDNGWFNAVIIPVSSAVLKDSIHDPQWQFYFRLCFYFWKDLYIRYPVFYPIVQATLAFALQTGAINSTTANALLEELSAVGKHHNAPEGALTSAILDFELAAKDLQQAKMDSIARQFEELLMSESSSDHIKEDDMIIEKSESSD